MKKEDSLQLAVCMYIKLSYPNVLFNTDLSGIKLTMGQAIKVKKLRSNRGFPDMVVYYSNSKYHGLFLELKSVTPFKKNGELKKDSHLTEQLIMINKLNEFGYSAHFVWEFDHAKEIIDTYLGLK